jgi:hypothetical protein
MIAETLGDLTQIGFGQAQKPYPRLTRLASSHMGEEIKGESMTTDGDRRWAERFIQPDIPGANSNGEDEDEDEELEYITRDSPISVDTRWMLLFYTVYGCKATTANVAKRFELC